MPSSIKLSIPVVIGASLLLAACGSSANSSNPSRSGTSASSAPPGSASGSSDLTIGTAKSSAGPYLTGRSGRALYVWVADPKGRSRCSGACADNWPPLTARSTPSVTGNANRADLSLITRSNGIKQVAYNGRPLYYFIGDSGSGMANGEGSDGFGARWWLVTPSGGQLTKTSVGSAASSSSGY